MAQRGSVQKFQTPGRARFMEKIERALAGRTQIRLPVMPKAPGLQATVDMLGTTPECAIFEFGLT